MVKVRLAAIVALLAVVLLGAFEKKAEAYNPYFPWCWEDYVACNQSGQHPGDCNCWYQICIGGQCD